jgi:hypothetical protein
MQDKLHAGQYIRAMKKTNHDTHHSKNSPTNRCGTMDTDDEAAG